jgi:hypothetical protein
MSAPASRKARKDAAMADARPSRVNWERVNVWFLRTLALAWICHGLLAWATILGVDPWSASAFESRRMTFQAATIYFAVADLLAGVGLWLLAPWGGVVWLLAAVSRLGLSFAFPAILPLDLIGAAIILALVGLFIGLSWMANASARR